MDYRVSKYSNLRNDNYEWLGMDDKELFVENCTEYPNSKSLKYYKENPIEYSFNNYGFRTSDDFNDTEYGNVFLGCSHTMGVGHHLENSWAYKLNKMIDSKYTDYKKFAVVRNPYNRFQSLIKMLKRDSKPYDPMMVLEIIQDDSISYKAIHALSQDILSSFIKRHGLPMSHEHYCVCKNDKINIDYVFRYEKLSNEVVKIENLTENKFKLKKLNNTDGVSIDGLFSDEVVSILNKVYEKDFDLFQYDRGVGI